LENRNLTDIELITLLKSDKKNESDAAFRAIYNLYSARIHAYCYKILKDKQKAEDIFQETFIKFYQNVRTDRLSTGSLIGFLITISRNLCLNEKRDNMNLISFNSVMYFKHSEVYSNDSDTKEIIKSAIERLEMTYREPLVLRLYEGLEYSEIAEICEITEENARKRVFRAKQKIKELLQPFYAELLN
jgi:RNA polymerase sigma-70 factor (ECF subfamily)